MTGVSESQSCSVEVSCHKVGGGDKSQRADKIGGSITHKRYVSVGLAYSRTSIRLPTCVFVDLKTTLYTQKVTTWQGRAGQGRADQNFKFYAKGCINIAKL